MSKRRLVITAVLAGSSQSEVARTYGVSQGWISRLMARYRTEGDAAFEPASRAPHTSPTATSAVDVALILALRTELTGQGHDAGADTIGWHLEHRHGVRVSRATIHRVLVRNGAVTPDPAKRPRSSYLRFEADQPNETWQSDFTHYRLTQPDGRPGADVEVITWLDDHSRFALHVSAHPRITAAIVLDTFTAAATEHGHPASTLTDNGMVYTVRFAGGRGGRTRLEVELRRLGITQKNSRPNHPTTCGKVERFQQTLKKWLRAQPEQPATLTALQALLDTFRQQYNHDRPHRSLPHHATPAAAYTARPKASARTDRSSDTHDRVRTDRVSKTGNVTLRHNGRLHHIGIGRTHAGTYVRLLVQDLQVTVIDAATGEVLRDFVLDASRDYQPTGRPTA
ncbi:IS481 family transposase, partial [Terrabacter aeriphilus]|uniref:IS481 family transposase n=1 Tax=Terrabacter aeriphilus TaxID=515662 RepID=UPI003CD05B2F